MRICIVGTGYVGLVSAACFAEMGNDVRCVDVNPEVVALLDSGRIHIFEPGLEDLVSRNRQEGRLRFTTSLADGLDDAEFAFITVGTPSRPDGSCDLSFVEGVDLSFKVTVKTNAKFESDGVDQIKKSLEDYINGLGVGKWVYHSALYGCVYGVTGVENVESITISVAGAAYTTDDVEIDATSVAQTSKSKIEVTKDV